MFQKPLPSSFETKFEEMMGEMPHTAFRCKVERLVKRCRIAAKNIFSEMTHF